MSNKNGSRKPVKVTLPANNANVANAPVVVVEEPKAPKRIFCTNLTVTNKAERSAKAQLLLLARLTAQNVNSAMAAKAAKKAAINNKVTAAAQTKYPFNCKSMQALANYCVEHSFSTLQTALAFTEAYNSNGITNAAQIAKRIAIYKDLAITKFKVTPKTAPKTV